MAAVFRAIPDQPAPLSELGVPDSVRPLTELSHGLVLIAGPAVVAYGDDVAAADRAADTMAGALAEALAGAWSSLAGPSRSRRCTPLMV